MRANGVNKGQIKNKVLRRSGNDGQIAHNSLVLVGVLSEEGVLRTEKPLKGWSVQDEHLDIPLACDGGGARLVL